MCSIASLMVKSPFATFQSILTFSTPTQAILASVPAGVPGGKMDTAPFSEATFNAPPAAAFTQVSLPVSIASFTTSSASIFSPEKTFLARFIPIPINAALIPAFPAFFPILMANSFV